MANAKMTNPELMIQAGINPKNGLPYKFTNEVEKPELKKQIRMAIRVLDEQNAINRYVWYNLPSGIDGQLLERILYYKGQGAFFYIESLEKFFFLPYALNGTIDVYGRFKAITPLPFNGSATTEDSPISKNITRFPVYKIIEDTDDYDFDFFMDGCVLLSDYSKQISQTIIPRKDLNEPILDMMSEAFPFARTSLLANCGVKGMRVNDEDQQAQVKEASRALVRAGLNGDPWIPIVAPTEMQDLTNGSALKSQEYLQYMQALDNFRLSLYGLKNGGIFEKDSAYVNTITAGNIQNNVGLVYQDGLTIRQKFCDIVNSIWGLGIWCESSETVLNTDTNADGQISDTEQTNEQSGGEEDVDIEQ